MTYRLSPSLLNFLSLRLNSMSMEIFSSGLVWRSGWVVESASLLKKWTSKGFRGFESRLLRHFIKLASKWQTIDLSISQQTTCWLFYFLTYDSIKLFSGFPYCSFVGVTLFMSTVWASLPKLTVNFPPVKKLAYLRWLTQTAFAPRSWIMGLPSFPSMFPTVTAI